MNESIMYAEVYEILNILGQDYINKIPYDFYKFIDESRNKNIVVRFNVNIPLEQQKISDETIEFISLLNLKYWCTKEQKEDLVKKYNDNEIKHQKNLKEKYNTNNLFEKFNSTNYTSKKGQNQTAIIEIKENLFVKFIKKIKNIFI